MDICKTIPAVRHNPRTASYRSAGKSVQLTQSQGALRPLMVACLTIQSTECKYTTVAASRGEKKKRNLRLLFKPWPEGYSTCETPASTAMQVGRLEDVDVM